MTYATKADGSPPDTYLTLSPKTPFQVGKIQTLGNKLFGYSGEVSYDVSAAATYSMMNFVLERSALVNFNFYCDLEAMGSDTTGFNIAIESISVVHMIWDVNPAGDGVMNANPSGQILIPANRDVSITLQNPSGVSYLVKMNCTLIGEYLE
jgi:hypothetical protein